MATTYVQPRSAEECLYWFPTIVKKAGNDWAKGFAKSILRQSRRRDWQPSPKQLALMRNMVSDLFTHESADDDDSPLIE